MRQEIQADEAPEQKQGIGLAVGSVSSQSFFDHVPPGISIIRPVG
jgi:hypothetical protein